MTLEIRQPDVTKAVSEVSAHGKVREELVAVQRKIGNAVALSWTEETSGQLYYRMQK